MTGARTSLRQVWPLALPAVAGQVFEPLLGMLDVGMLGATNTGMAQVAAVGACAFTFMTLMNLATGLGQGTQALVARSLGARQEEDAAGWSVVGLQAALVLGAGVLGAVWLLAPTLASLVCAPEAVESGVDYLRARAVGAPLGAVLASARGSLLARKQPMKVVAGMAVGAVVHAALNVILIPMAPLGGLSGAGVAAASSAVGVAVASMWLVMAVQPRPGTAHRVAVRALLKMSLPPALQGFFTALGYAAFLGALGRAGAQAQGVAAMLVNLAAVAYLVAMGMGAAAATLVGHALGAGDTARARQEIGTVVQAALLVAGPFLALLMLVPEVPLHILGAHDDILPLAATSLRWLVLGVLGDQVGVVCMLALVVAGKGAWVAGGQLGLHWGVLVPGAFFLSSHGMALPGAMVLFAGYRLLVAGVFGGMAWRLGRGVAAR